VVSSRGRRNQRAVKRKMSNWPVKSKRRVATVLKLMKYEITVLK
jgi:hypothetical protein